MPLFHLASDAIIPVETATFAAAEVRERQDLQRLLRDHLEAVSPDTMVLAEEFCDWEESRRRIDLLGLDKEARIVVIELKRTEDGGHMELQAVRYAAMVSKMTFAQAVAAHARYLKARGMGQDAEQAILEFLGWDEPDEEGFANDTRIVLVSADFSKEITTSMLWLRDYGLEITCIRLVLYRIEGKLYIDVQRVIPLPEAEDYIERLGRKSRAERRDRESRRDFTKLDVSIGAVVHQRLPKRRAAFLLIKHLCDSGVRPGEIEEAAGHRRALWYFVEAETDSEGFLDAAREKARSGGPAFDPIRWFVGDDELVRAGGSTYALTNQWGGKSRDVIDALLTKWSDREVSVVASQE